MNALKLIDKIIEEENHLNIGFSGWMDADHAASAFNMKLTPIEDYLVTAFLGGVMGGINEIEMKNGIENIIDLYNEADSFFKRDTEINY